MEPSDTYATHSVVWACFPSIVAKHGMAGQRVHKPNEIVGDLSAHNRRSVVRPTLERARLGGTDVGVVNACVQNQRVHD